MAVDAHRNLAIVDRKSFTVRLVAHATGTFYGRRMIAGHMYTIASDPGLFGLYGIAFDRVGNLILTTGNYGEVLVVAVRSGTFYRHHMTSRHTYLIGDGGTQTGDGIPATAAALIYAAGVTVDASGNILIADSGNGRVRCIPGSSGNFYGQPMTVGDIYTIAGNGTGAYSGDGGPATDAGVGATGLALDTHGNIVIADARNFRVRVVATTPGHFYGQPMAAGDIYTIAGNGKDANTGNGGLARSAAISGPWDQSVAVDTAGNVVITTSNQVRVVAASSRIFYGVSMKTGHIYIAAGTGRTGFSGDDGPALKAELAEVDSVAIGPAGNILVGDMLRIRSIAP